MSSCFLAAILYCFASISIFERAFLFLDSQIYDYNAPLLLEEYKNLDSNRLDDDLKALYNFLYDADYASKEKERPNWSVDDIQGYRLKGYKPTSSHNLESECTFSSLSQVIKDPQKCSAEIEKIKNLRKEMMKQWITKWLKKSFSSVYKKSSSLLSAPFKRSSLSYFADKKPLNQQVFTFLKAL